MYVIVGGCGQLGAEIAERLSEDQDNDVVVVDNEPLAFDRIGAAFNGETVAGDITDRDILERAGVDRADGLIAVTKFDNVNLMAVEIAQVLYGVPRAVARLFNPEREPVYRKLGVRYVSGTGVLAKLILNTFGEIGFPYHLHFPSGDLHVVDLEIGGAGAGLTVQQLERTGKLRVAAVTRGRRSFLPRDDERLNQGDVVTAAVGSGARDRLEDVVEPGPRTRAKEDD